MSLPMTATGPLNVLTKPILIDLFWAAAGPAASNTAALAANKTFRMMFSSQRPFSGPCVQAANLTGPAVKGPPPSAPRC